MSYKITIEVKDVADGDVTDLADAIWNENAETFDADRGDFVVSISKDGFDIGWEPTDA